MIDLSKDMGIPKEDLEATPQSVLDLVGAILARNGALTKRVEELEARLGKNSSNFSKPPSSAASSRLSGHFTRTRKSASTAAKRIDLWHTYRDGRG